MHRLSNQIRAVVAGVLLLAILAVLWLSISSLTSLGATINSVYVDSAMQQAESFLRRVAAEQAERYDARFRRYLMQVANQAAALSHFYEREAQLDDAQVKVDAILSERLANGGYGNTRDEPASIFYWGGNALDDVLRRELMVTSYLEPVLVEAQVSDPLITAAWIITSSGIGRYTPNTDPHRDWPAGFDLRNPEHDPVYSVATPAFNPEKTARYSGLYMDAAGQGVIVSAVAPVYRADGRYAATTGVDVSLSDMRREILSFTGFSQTGDATGFAFLVAADGQAIAFPPSQLDVLGLTHPEELLELNLLSTSNAQFSELVRRMISRQAESVGLERLQLAGNNYYVAHSGMASTGWRLGLAYPEDEVLRGSEAIGTTAGIAVKDTILRIGGVAVFGFVLVGALVTLFLRYRLLHPLEGLNASARRIADGDLQAPIDTSGRDELATLAGNLSTMRDAVRETLDRLRDSEQRLQSIIDNAPAAIYVKDLSGRFQLMNRHCSQLLGTSPEQAIGKQDHDFLPPPVAHEVGLNDRRVIDAGVPLHVEEAIPVDGETRTFVSIKFPLQDHRGQVLGVCGISTDITDRKQVEHELQQHRTRLSEMVAERTRELSIARERAESANRAKTSFLANMSHEIRTPMNGVLSLAQLLARGELSEKDRHYVELILNAGRALMTVLNDILDYSKIEAGQVSAVRAPFSLEHLVRDIEGLMLPLAEQKKLEFRTTCARDLPDRVVGDSSRLRQVVLNLVGNAIKFTERGRVTLRLSDLSRGHDPVRLRIEVEDSGPGISAADLEHIFDRFFRAGIDTGPAGTGSGLGLSICKKLVELMDGEIGVSSVPGEGSRFHIEIDLPKALDESGTRDDAAQLQAPAPGPLRILVADDDPIGRMACQTLLEQVGHRITVADNGSEALAALEGGDFDLVLMDIHMPVMDGLEATRRVRDHADPRIRDIPVLALTASVMNDEYHRYLDMGITAVLAKPLSIDELNRTIQDALQDGARVH
ncbi:MAG: response regulator [Gammaproteobacteria bacterium]|nr:response regulator [Gammaproteobacteria bacterium]